MFKPIAAFVVILPALWPAVLHAAEVRNTTNYQIAISGIPLANAFFQASQNGKSYSVDAQLATTGIAEAIASTKAEMSSKGTVRGGRWLPEDYAFRYKSGKRSRSFETTFRAGDVVRTVIQPEPKRRKNWIPTTPADLRAVADPIAALVIPGDRNPCSKPLSIYDGETRLELELGPKGEKTFKTEGFSGPVKVCSLRYEPKAGYRKGHRDIEYIRKLTNIEIWFAKAPSMNVYAPVYLSVPTSFGALTIKATHFGG